MWKRLWTWVMGGGGKRSKEHARNRNAKGDSGEI